MFFLQKNEPATVSIANYELTDVKMDFDSPTHCHFPKLIVGSVTDNSLTQELLNVTKKSAKVLGSTF